MHFFLSGRTTVLAKNMHVTQNNIFVPNKANHVTAVDSEQSVLYPILPNPPKSKSKALRIFAAQYESPETLDM